MSYAVLRMQKVKATGVKGMQFHNQRERESQTNPDIDYEKSKLNYDLVNDHSINFNKKVGEIIKENVIIDKKIRKDAVRMCDIVITSDPKFFEGLTGKEIGRFFKDSFNFLSDRYGNKNVVYSTVHLDESTPHMHFGFVPVTKDNRLSAKDIFNRQGLRDLQTDYQKFISDKGFELERGIPSNKKGLSTQEFKKKLFQDDIEAKKHNLNALKNDLEALGRDLKVTRVVKDDIERINEIKAPKALLNKDKVILSVLDYENLLKVSRMSLIEHEKVIDPYKSLIYKYKKQNEGMKKEIDGLKEKANKKESLSNVFELSKEKAAFRNQTASKEKYIKELESFIKDNKLENEFINYSRDEEKSFELEM